MKAWVSLEGKGKLAESMWDEESEKEIAVNI